MTQTARRQWTWSHGGPGQLRPGWLTTAVGIRRLGRPVLQAIQDLPFANIAVSHQQELEQVVVALHRAALAAHRLSHLSWPMNNRKLLLHTSQQRDRRQTNNPTVCVRVLLCSLNKHKADVCHPMNSTCPATVLKNCVNADCCQSKIGHWKESQGNVLFWFQTAKTSLLLKVIRRKVSTQIDVSGAECRRGSDVSTWYLLSNLWWASYLKVKP